MEVENVSFMVQMGFPEDISKSALSATGNNLEAAITWALEKKNEESNESQEAGVNNGNGTSNAVEPDESNDTSGAAKSLKCEECGKLFKNIEAAELHGLRTQHENFSECSEEIKPLTDEEKKQQAERIQQLISERRLKRAKEDEEGARLKEIERRHAARNLNQIKEQMKEAEIKKAVDDRRREKQEDRLAKQRVLEQIERDKAERKQRLEGGGKVSEQSTVPVNVVVPQPPAAPTKSNAAETRLQLRLPSGSSVVQVFASSESLAAVRCLVLMRDTTLGPSPADISLMCPFQNRRVFTEEDMEKSLTDLGLAPSAALIVTKKI